MAISASTDALTGAVTAGDNTTFLPFDEERYSLIRADGTVETLTHDKFTYNNDNRINPDILSPLKNNPYAKPLNVF